MRTKFVIFIVKLALEKLKHIKNKLKKKKRFSYVESMFLYNSYYSNSDAFSTLSQSVDYLDSLSTILEENESESDDSDILITLL